MNLIQNKIWNLIRDMCNIVNGPDSEDIGEQERNEIPKSTSRFW